MAKIIVFLTAASIATAVVADGLPLKHGRYPGQVIIFDLTKDQKTTRFRSCHIENSGRMNIYTPYVFTLTPSQSRVVREAAGFTPSRFNVYETYLGFNDAGPHWNLALRYSQDRPVKLLLRDKEAARAQCKGGSRQTHVFQSPGAKRPISNNGKIHNVDKALYQ